MKVSPTGAPAWTSSKPPLLRFLNACHAKDLAETSGAVADYIPELGKADPAHFGISLATLDGHVYEVGDTKVPFTIQSMSKPFVFALALDTLGAARVESAIGVEPSGDPFNSIRLNAENHPFNPMVNAGAIACSGLIHEAKGDGAAGLGSEIGVTGVQEPQQGRLRTGPGSGAGVKRRRRLFHRLLLCNAIRVRATGSASGRPDGGSGTARPGSLAR